MSLLLLFPDAEGVEDVLEDIVGGDFTAGDFTEVVEALAQVFCYEVGGNSGFKGLLGSLQGVDGLFQGIVVADVCYYGVCCVQCHWHG